MSNFKTKVEIRISNSLNIVQYSEKDKHYVEDNFLFELKKYYEDEGFISLKDHNENIYIMSVDKLLNAEITISSEPKSTWGK